MHGTPHPPAYHGKWWTWERLMKENSKEKEK